MENKHFGGNRRPDMVREEVATIVVEEAPKTGGFTNFVSNNKRTISISLASAVVVGVGVWAYKKFFGKKKDANNCSEKAEDSKDAE